MKKRAMVSERLRPNRFPRHCFACIYSSLAEISLSFMAVQQVTRGRYKRITEQFFKPHTMKPFYLSFVSINK